MPSEAEYIDAHSKGMTISQRRDWVRKQAKLEDEYYDLPIKFPKPKTKLGPKFPVECPYCGHIFGKTRHTVLVICGECKKLVRIKD